ncbi:hypothetical protein HAX54_001168 [Datura stramonium]|uniref:Uncharacterized protein n=1 Tax=Datura stramonium TaxID=4076 RepID=A0ABS8T3E1_DATST|nr:hypothetical protein [Datura stramonium]
MVAAAVQPSPAASLSSKFGNASHFPPLIAKETPKSPIPRNPENVKKFADLISPSTMDTPPIDNREEPIPIKKVNYVDGEPGHEIKGRARLNQKAVDGGRVVGRQDVWQDTKDNRVFNKVKSPSKVTNKATVTVDNREGEIQTSNTFVMLCEEDDKVDESGQDNEKYLENSRGRKGIEGKDMEKNEMGG